MRSYHARFFIISRMFLDNTHVAYAFTNYFWFFCDESEFERHHFPENKGERRIGSSISRKCLESISDKTEFSSFDTSAPYHS